MTSPFASPQQPPALPVVLKPLRYCEFRTAEQAQYGETADVVLCAVFASEVIEQMCFCYQHGLIIQDALVKEHGG